MQEPLICLRMYWNKLQEKMKGKLRLTLKVTPFKLFLDHSCSKSQGCIEITNPVAWIFLTWTAQAAQYLLPSSKKASTQRAWCDYPPKNWVPCLNIEYRWIALG